MSDPKSEGQPDTYGGTNWKTIECGTPHNDYCRVHTNSGVLNHWFYLDDRKSGTNDIGNSYNVTGINIDKAAKIAYRLEVFICLLILLMLMPELMVFNRQRTYGAGSPEVIATTMHFSSRCWFSLWSSRILLQKEIVLLMNISVKFN
jgi:hypothetical protein